MEKKKLAKDLKHILKIEFDIDQSLINNNTNLLSTGILDSHNLMEFIILIEKKYKIKINPMKISLDNWYRLTGLYIALIN